MSGYPPEVQAELDARYPRTVREIDHDRWWELLECLPPERWHTWNGWESFNLMEHAYGDTAQICVHHRASGKFWTFYGPVRTSPEWRAAYVMANLSQGVTP